MSGYHYQISEASRLLAVEAHVLRYWEEELGMIIPRNEMGHRYYTEEHLRIFSQIKDMKERGYQLRAIRAILSGEEEPPESFTAGNVQREEQTERSASCGGQVTEIPLKKNQEEPAESPGGIYAKQVENPGKASVTVPGQKNEPVKIPRTRNLPPEEMPQVNPVTVPDQVEKPERNVQNGQEIPSCGTLSGEFSADNPNSGQRRMDQFQAVMTHIIAQAMLCNNPGLAREISQHVEEDLLPEIKQLLKVSEGRQEERFRKLDEFMRSIQQGNRARYEAAASKSPGLFGRRRRRQRYRRI
ncbi:MAG: helix-turn-helix domain-containing protein [Lachnospiraceae bacterium]|nr:helix-turn-helix domain-containing protein [Lachnospiraceae bacterium]